MNRSQQAIMRTATRRPGGYTVTCQSGRLTARQAMAGLRNDGLVVQEVREGWFGNWLTAAGLQEAGLEENAEIAK